VDLTVLVPPEFSFSPSTVSFTGAVELVSNPSPSVQTVDLTNTGQVDLDWELVAPVVYVSGDSGWLGASPSGGTALANSANSNTVTLTADSLTPGVSAGDHVAHVTVREVGYPSNAATITVNLHVMERAAIALAPSSMSFVAEVGTSPADMALAIQNIGEAQLAWSTASDRAWLSILPSTGTCAGGGQSVATVSVDSAALAEGTYTGSIEVSDANASNSPRHLTVSLHVTPPAIWVDDNGGAGGTGTYANPYPTITQAMDVAVSGDVVMVKPGTYYESVSIPATGISLISEQGSAVTTIQGTGSGTTSGVSLPSGSPSNVVVEGFTISDFYRGIYAYYGVTARDCVIEYCNSSAISITYGYGTTITHCTIRYNNAGIRCGGSPSGSYDSVISNNLIVWNSGYGLYLDGYGSMSFEVVTAENNTIADNGGNGVSFWNAGAVVLRNNIIAYNDGYGVGSTAYYAPTVYSCDVYGNYDGQYHVDVGDQTGTAGNISAAPVFVSYLTDDYRISSTSPCRNTGTNSAFVLPTDIRGLTRVVGGTIDMGCYEWQTPDP